MKCCVRGSLVAPLIMLHVQGTCCAGRWWHGQDQAGHGAVAGALAGLSMYFYSSPSLALYTMWKVVEVSWPFSLSEQISCNDIGAAFLYTWVRCDGCFIMELI